MNEWIKKNISKIVAIFILFQPILDLLTGICVNTLKIDITIGIIIRILFLVVMCLIALFTFKKKKLIIPYLIIGIYFICYGIGMYLFKNEFLLVEVKNLFRTFYYPILLVTLFYLKEDIKISKMTMFTILFLYLIFLFVPTLFGLGYKSYLETKTGTLGFFNSANEISGILSILTPFMLIIFYESKRIVPIIILSIMYLVVILMIGTKTPLISLVITIGFSLMYLWIRSIKEKKWKQMGLSILVVCIGIASLIVVIPKTNFYKNIETHLEYLEIEHVTDVLKDEHLIDHFIFSSRLNFLKNKSFIYYNAPMYEKLFGIGYVNEDEETKLIEMDFFDIYYSHGLIGAFIFFTILLFISYDVLKGCKIRKYNELMNFTALFLVVFLSFFTGHIITAPAVSLLSIIILLSLANREKKDILFTGYNLDIGGIEKAQVNLIKYMDKTKYNVTLILEKKEGDFLKDLDSSVRVEECKVSNYQDKIIRKIINVSRKLYFKILNYHNYDFSCCYTTYSYSANKLALMASNNNAFYIHSNYGLIFATENEFKEFFNTRNITKYKRLFFVSKESQDSFLKTYPSLKSKTIVMNNFVDIEEILTKSEEKVTEKKPSSKTLFVFVGRLEDASKKINRALNLVKEIPSIELWIVGDGPDRNMYEEYVEKNDLKKRVKFLGKKANPYPYMKQADYVILTSDYEGFPVTYLEAITLGKQIITTIPTSDDEINMKKIAHIVSKDEKEMVKEVKKILKEKKDKPKIDLKKVQEKRIQHWKEIFDE